MIERIIQAVVNQQMFEFDTLEEIIPGGENAPYIQFINPKYHDLIDMQVRDEL